MILNYFYLCGLNFKLFYFFQQFGPILDVEIIFNERGSKVIIVNCHQ